MRQLLISTLSLFLCTFVLAQDITVKDKITRHPLEFVTVYDKENNITLTTNEQGKVSMQPFAKTDTIFFRMMGYGTKRISLEDLKSRNYKVYLKPEDIFLGEVIISASRFEQGKGDVPNKVSVLKPKDAILYNPQTTADLLTESGYVFMQKSQLGGGSPMIRGFAANRVLIAVDGVRMNNAIFRSGNLQNIISIDPFAIDKTEIMFGPGTVVYGSDALGGVMSFYTLKPKLSGEKKPYISSHAAFRWSSANMEQTAHFDFNAGFKKWAFLSNVSYSMFKDLQMGSDGLDDYLRPEYVGNIFGKDTILVNPDPELQKKSGYSQINLMQKIRYQASKKWNIEYGVHFSKTSDVDRYDRMIRYKSAQLKSAEWYYGPQIWAMNTIHINHISDSSYFDKMNIIAAWQFFEESRHVRDFQDSTLYHRTENVNAFSLNIDFEKKLKKKRILYYGIEMITNTVSSKGEAENILDNSFSQINSRYPDGSKWNSLAAYITYGHQISKSIKISSGLRYNHFSLSSEFDTTLFPLPYTEAKLAKGSLNGSIGSSWTPSKKWKIDLNFSSGFRAPNVDDMAKVFDSEPGNVIIPNPNLLPEYSINSELGFQKLFGKRARLEVNAFYSILIDALVRRDYTLDGQDSIMYEGEMSRVQAVQNASSAFIYGLQAGFDLRLPYNLNFSSRLTWQKGKEEGENGDFVPLRHAGPWYGSTHLGWNFGQIRADVYALYNGEISNSGLAPSEQSKAYIYALDKDGLPYSPAWWTLNLKFVYQMSDNLSLSGGIENILDKRYRPYSSGITSAGRNFIIAIRAGL